MPAITAKKTFSVACTRFPRGSPILSSPVRAGFDAFPGAAVETPALEVPVDVGPVETQQSPELHAAELGRVTSDCLFAHAEIAGRLANVPKMRAHRPVSSSRTRR